MRRIAVAFVLLAFCVPAFAQVTSNSLLKEMVDFEKLTRRPDPFYKTSQASSYDRRSTSPDEGGWFANADWGKFIRVEEVDGRKEYVMADLEGPGAVVRIWSANPEGSIRFYFDGEKEPRIVARTGDILRGFFSFMKRPFGYFALRGTNLYFPMPYEKSLKITVDNSDNDDPRMYYHVGYRTFEASANVETYEAESVDQDLMSSIGDILNNPDTRPTPSDTSEDSSKFDISSGEAWLKTVEGKGIAVSEFQIAMDMPTIPYAVKRWTDPRHPHHLLRDLWLEISFDGKTMVRAPVADFFGAPPAGAAYRSFAFSISEDDVMTCRFWMPFQQEMSVKLINKGRVRVHGSLNLKVSPYKWDENSRYFHSQWTAVRGETHPGWSFDYFDIEGEGHYVGSTLYIGNDSPNWWGEGDEKIYVDGEAFPSTFGTGTEDYYGYAWSDPQPYDNIPYHTQPNAGSPGNMGHISNNRWHLLDPITFNKSLRFNMEILHHRQDVHATYAATSYWYANRDSTGPVEINAGLINVEELLPPPPVEGAIEGEDLTVVTYSGGAIEKQGGFFGMSNDLQLWWIDGEVGDYIDFEFDVVEGGTYKILGALCHAPDYGIHAISINGQDAVVHDSYGPGVGWKRIEFGTFTLKKGKSRLRFTITGANEKSEPKRHMLGLDYILLEKQ